MHESQRLAPAFSGPYVTGVSCDTFVIGTRADPSNTTTNGATGILAYGPRSAKRRYARSHSHSHGELVDPKCCRCRRH